MLSANGAERTSQLGPGKNPHRIGTEKREGDRLTQAIPKVLELTHSGVVSLLAEHGYHLAEDSDAATAIRRPRQRRTQSCCKSVRLRRPMNHQLGQGLCSIERNISATRGGGGRIQPGSHQSLLKRREVSSRCNYNAPFALIQ